MTGFGPVRPSTGRVKLIALHPLPLHLNTLALVRPIIKVSYLVRAPIIQFVLTPTMPYVAPTICRVKNVLSLDLDFRCYKQHFF